VKKKIGKKRAKNKKKEKVKKRGRIKEAKGRGEKLGGKFGNKRKREDSTAHLLVQVLQLSRRHLMSKEAGN